MNIEVRIIEERPDCGEKRSVQGFCLLAKQPRKARRSGHIALDHCVAATERMIEGSGMVGGGKNSTDDERWCS
jgi:hypothetical protein